ncbi:MAG: ABC transporter substrate-binding protein [Patescibacteria group bacterium]|jgi:branched-chain amino acid transport system substrate-binding protein
MGSLSKNYWFWLGGLVLVVVIALSMSFSFARDDSKAQDKTLIKIGFVAPQTGNAASYGEYTTKAFKLGIDDFNATHKINFDVVYEDGKCDGASATTAINKLINVDKVQYVIGGLCSGETLAMAPVAETNKVILFSPGSGSPDITNAGDYIFRNLASDDYTAKEIAKVAISKGDKDIGTISENIDYPQALKKAFSSYFISQGGEIQLDETFASGTTDFRTILAKFKSQNINTIYLVIQSYKTSALILKQMKELGFEPKIYTSEAIINPEALNYYDDAYKNLLEGAIFTQPKFDEANSKTATVLAEFKARYNTIEGPMPTVYIATYYDSVYLLGEAIEKGGDAPDKVKNYFNNKIKNWPGAVGNFNFDKNGDAVTDVEAKTLKNGQIVSL